MTKILSGICVLAFVVGCDSEGKSAGPGEVGDSAAPDEPQAVGVPDRGKDSRLAQIELPSGFQIHVYAEGLTGARSLSMSTGGTLFVGTQNEGSVYAAVDADGDSFAETVHVVDRGLQSPNGVAFRDGSLYVAEVSRVLRYDDIEQSLENPPEPVVVNDSFPSDRHHGWKFIRFGPDGLLYVPVGAPCNICAPDDPYAAILRMQPDGTGLEVFARGVRNTVGFDWHSGTGELWFTDNGRDFLGNDSPPDELNHAPAAGLHFGYPYCHGGTIQDPDFGAKGECGDFEAPAQNLGPHVAAIGMRFYNGAMFPAEYRNQVFIAEHGSWNRSQKIGYRVSVVKLEGDQAVSYEPFAQGWLQGQSAWGRPVDVLVMGDGSLLVSDDQRGVVYRIVYSGSG